MSCSPCGVCSFFFSDTATPEIYTLSLHDALPIFARGARGAAARAGRRRGPCAAPAGDGGAGGAGGARARPPHRGEDRKSTRLNSSHEWISYAVFCLKKKRNTTAGQKRQDLQTRHT